MIKKFIVYLILSKSNKKVTSYVGYTINLKNRLKNHNNSKGAKFTRGRKWIVIYSKTYSSKSTALKYEYKLKKNYKLRKKIKLNYLKKKYNKN